MTVCLHDPHRSATTNLLLSCGATSSSSHAAGGRAQARGCGAHGRTCEILRAANRGRPCKKSASFPVKGLGLGLGVGLGVGLRLGLGLANPYPSLSPNPSKPDETLRLSLGITHPVVPSFHRRLGPQCPFPAGAASGLGLGLGLGQPPLAQPRNPNPNPNHRPH